MSRRCSTAFAMVVENIGFDEIQRIRTLIKFGRCGKSFAAVVFTDQPIATFVFGSPAVFNMMRVDVPVAVIRQRIIRRRVSRSMGIPDGRYRESMVRGLQMGNTRQFVRMTELQGY